MSLSVHVFVEADGEMTLLDDARPGADLAGFESFRVTVWGSAAVRDLGARFLPRLAGHDLRVANDELAEFQAECALVRANLDRILPEPNESHTREWYLDTIAARLANIEAAAQRAQDIGGGVLIW